MSTEPTAEFRHLLPYGYAPGHYMNQCVVCGGMQFNCDKRAYVCKTCAEKRHAEDQGKPATP